MSAEDKLRSFAETNCLEHEVIRDGVTYGDARAVLAELALARETRDAAQKASTKAVIERREAQLVADGFEAELKRLRHLIGEHGYRQVYDMRFTCKCGKTFMWEDHAMDAADAREKAVMAAKLAWWVQQRELCMLCPQCAEESTCHVCGAKLTLACPNCEVP